MSGVSGISGSSANYYQPLATGRRINSAADDAAGLSVSEELDRNATGLDAGSNNIRSAQDLIKVADGAESQVSDYLQRMKELAVAASNDAVVSDDERRAYQDEIDQLKKGIADIAEQTMYNGKRLLDGDGSFSLATDSNGNTASFNVGQSTLRSLGIENFDVTGQFDMSVLDNAIQSVSGNRSSMGASSNGMDYAYNFNTQASYNVTSASSRIADTDYPQAVTEQKKKENLQAYAVLMQKKQQEDEQRRTQNFFTNTNIFTS